MAAAHAAAAICRPLGARQFRNILILGLTPQANYLSPLRGLIDGALSLFLGLTPQAKYLSPLPASPFGLRRDKSRLDGWRFVSFFQIFVVLSGRYLERLHQRLSSILEEDGRRLQHDSVHENLCREQAC